MQPSAYPTAVSSLIAGNQASDIGRLSGDASGGPWPPPPAAACRFGSGEGGSDTASLALHAARVPGGACVGLALGLAGGRAGRSVLKTKKRLYTTTGVGTEPQRSDAGRDTRADGADPRGGGGRYYIAQVRADPAARSCVSHTTESLLGKLARMTASGPGGRRCVAMRAKSNRKRRDS